MYPCAGGDIAEPIQVFGGLFDTFLFVDLQYNVQSAEPAIPGWNIVAGSQRRLGSSNSSVRHCSVGLSRFRVIDPEWFFSDYKNEANGKRISIVRRRGFGQYALQELPDGSLSMFMHRGDSPGEGGSNVFYLANRRTSHEPLSNLMNVLKCKLGYPALIASDGSNTTVPELVDTATGNAEVKSFVRYGLYWQRYLATDLLSGSTKVWQVSQHESGVQL